MTINNSEIHNIQGIRGIYLTLFTTFLLLLTTGCSNPKEIKILFLGNSITHGQPHHYRYDLWKYMIDAGWDVDLLGTIEDWNEYPEYKGTKFDTDHEGHPGWTSNQINSSLDNWLEFYTPDIVLYHIGTNDMWHYDVNTSLKKITETVYKLREDNPRIQIYLSQIIPIGNDNNWVQGINGYDWLENFNKRIILLADSLDNINSLIVIVDHNSNFTNEDLAEDKVHPSEKGANKMARNWAVAMKLENEE